MENLDFRHLVIAVCTYKRSEELKVCLNSLEVMHIPRDISITILIIDNDPALSANSLIANWSGKLEKNIRYVSEPKRGIPFARNKALEVARGFSATELVFIDDDEYVKSDWLTTLWNFYTNSHADVVYGYVETVYQQNTPSWVSANKVFTAEKKITGSELNWAATNNVIFNFNKLIEDMALKFDESFGLKGGSDFDFFSKAHERGVKILFCSEAVVFEPLALERTTFSYIWKRTFRACNNLKFSEGLNWRGRFFLTWKHLLRFSFFTSKTFVFVFLFLPDNVKMSWIQAGKELAFALNMLNIKWAWNEYDK